MATIKGYTDLEQSRNLAKILPIESADMYWKNGVSDKYIQCFTPFVINEDGTNIDFDYDIPCWSLASLLGVLPEKYTELIKEGNIYRIIIKDSYMTCLFGNPIDACYELILKLNELNYYNYERIKI